MGWVWNVLLSHSNEELWADGEDEPRETCQPIEEINEWISNGKLVDLVKPTYANGAGNGLDANLYGGGFKHFDIDGFIEVVEARNWKERAKVQLWVKGAEEGMGEDPFAGQATAATRTWPDEIQAQDACRVEGGDTSGHQETPRASQTHDLRGWRQLQLTLRRD